jgi:PAS domain S-box-containing protein
MKKSTENILHHSLKQAPLIVKTDLNGQILHANHMFESYLEYTNSELINKNLVNLISHAKREIFFEKLLETIKSDQAWNGGIVYQSKSNALIAVDLIAILLKNDKNDDSGFLFMHFVKEFIHEPKSKNYSIGKLLLVKIKNFFTK